MFNKDKIYVDILTEILAQVKGARKLAAKELKDPVRSIYYDSIALGLMNASDIVSKAFKESDDEETNY